MWRAVHVVWWALGAFLKCLSHVPQSSCEHHLLVCSYILLLVRLLRKGLGLLPFTVNPPRHPTPLSFRNSHSSPSISLPIFPPCPRLPLCGRCNGVPRNCVGPYSRPNLPLTSLLLGAHCRHRISSPGVCACLPSVAPNAGSISLWPFAVGLQDMQNWETHAASDY